MLGREEGADFLPNKWPVLMGGFWTGPFLCRGSSDSAVVQDGGDRAAVATNSAVV